MEKEELVKRAKIACDSFNGIVPYHEVFYIHSIIYSASRALEAFERYKELRKKEVNSSYLIATVQEAIGHSAALSRYFWPSGFNFRGPKELKKLKDSRAKKLRDKFGLSDNSTLKNQNLRDAWEHFDERLDIYLISNDAGSFFPSPIIDSHKLADDPNGKIFKLLDPDEECLVLLGKKFFFGPIIQEVLKIFSHAVKADNNGGRL
ncbi:MAG: hypothetical protein ACFFDN_34460 [Candidatus Hodarchaeota archaeon]